MSNTVRFRFNRPCSVVKIKFAKKSGSPDRHARESGHPEVFEIPGFRVALPRAVIRVARNDAQNAGKSRIVTMNTDEESEKKTLTMSPRQKLERSILMSYSNVWKTTLCCFI